ncbi:MAG TPA: S9 family peptidase, partial [Candidatus Limnocylindrales bacterium]|nr:S9 family peptidase [Candidatus Limnocylindrales bacterium]
LPDGETIVALGHRLEGRAGSRNDLWLLAADGSDASPTGGRNLSGRHDLMPRAGMTSDLTVGEAAPVIPSPDGCWLHFSAPIAGSYELWRIAVDDGRLERLTEGRHVVSNWHAVGRGRHGGAVRIAYLRSTPTEPPELWVLDTMAGRGGRTAAPRRLTELNGAVLAELELRAPQERHAEVDGRDIQGWFIPAGDGPRPLVVEIHGGPHALYGWAPVWEFQLLAAAGIGVFSCNPRGSEGYGQAFNDANHRDWGPGPMRDVLAGVDALVADGLADPDRLGVTGGSYGGYLTNWIVAHDHRFRAAMTCRSVSDMAVLFLTGDISGGDWARMSFDATPWEDPAYFREISPITYAPAIRTPLLIQHAERDLRTTIGQAEALFTVLRSLRRPVRLLRVPEETHELTRSGTPFRRVENLQIVVDWFRHFLVAGKRRLPPVPTVRDSP